MYFYKHLDLVHYLMFQLIMDTSKSKHLVCRRGAKEDVSIIINSFFIRNLIFARLLKYIATGRQ